MQARAWVGGRGSGSGLEGQGSDRWQGPGRRGRRSKLGASGGRGEGARAEGARAEAGSEMRGGGRGLGSGGRRSDLGERARAPGRVRSGGARD